MPSASWPYGVLRMNSAKFVFIEGNFSTQRRKGRKEERKESNRGQRIAIGHYLPRKSTLDM